MSGGAKCACGVGKTHPRDQLWRVTQRHCNHSRFSGSRRTASRYSEVHCLACKAYWRTTARYVAALPDLSPTERHR